MSLTEVVQDALKSGKVVLGYRESIKKIKSGNPKLIVIAKNIPKERKEQIEHNARIFNLKIEIFDGTSKELGVVCGKPFPISTLVILDADKI